LVHNTCISRTKKTAKKSNFVSVVVFFFIGRTVKIVAQTYLYAFIPNTEGRNVMSVISCICSCGFVIGTALWVNR
jgi:hypothetical protein